MATAFKVCLSCNKDLSLLEFSRNKRTKDGLEYYCRTCRSSREKSYRDKNKDKIRERDKKYRESNWSSIYSKQKKYREANLDKFREYHSQYYQDNKQKIKDNYLLHAEDRKSYSREWKKNNKDKKLASHYNRRDNERGAEGNYTLQEWAVLCEKYGNKCINPDCKSPTAPLTRDHIVPISKGGNNYISNIQPLCSVCNSKKRTSTMDYRTYYEI